MTDACPTRRSSDREDYRPGMEERLTTVHSLDGIVGRDGVAVSATTELANATSPATRLHEAASRYADAVTTATHQLQRGVADDALETAGPGPLPWLPGIPSEIGEPRELSKDRQSGVEGKSV